MFHFVFDIRPLSYTDKVKYRIQVKVSLSLDSLLNSKNKAHFSRPSVVNNKYGFFCEGFTCFNVWCSGFVSCNEVVHFLLIYQFILITGIYNQSFCAKSKLFNPQCYSLKQSIVYSTQKCNLHLSTRLHWMYSLLQRLMTWHSYSFLPQKCCCFVSRFHCGFFPQYSIIIWLTWLVSWGWSWLSFDLPKSIHSDPCTSSIINIDLSNPYCAKQNKEGCNEAKKSTKGDVLCCNQFFFCICTACASFLRGFFFSVQRDLFICTKVFFEGVQ